MSYRPSGDWMEQVMHKRGIPHTKTYVPSGDVEAVLAEIAAGESDGGPDFAAPLAETFGSVAEHRRRLAAAQLRERAASERDDPAAVEHEAERQARLARWQRLDRT